MGAIPEENEEKMLPSLTSLAATARSVLRNGTISPLTPPSVRVISRAKQRILLR